MFTGLVTDVGEVIARDANAEGARFTIRTGYNVAEIDNGASIAHNGCCLTVTDRFPGDSTYSVFVSNETLSVTTLGSWRIGSRINLEQSLRLGDPLDGHLVYGHVDGLAAVSRVTPDGESCHMEFRVPLTLGRFLAPKGSVALDGVSLTVNDVTTQANETVFDINIIPHTKSWTTFVDIAPGHWVNFEADMVARYVARLIAVDQVREKKD